MSVRGVAIIALASVAACGGDTRDPGSRASTGSTITVYNAGSLAVPIRLALDSFAARAGVRVEQENAGSLETARKLTELGRVPEVIALADAEVFPRLLMPDHVRWYVKFAHNRMVLAYTDRSRFAAEMDSTSWWRIVQRPGVAVGRADPNLDPNGYRTLLVMQLAERHYRQPGLAARLLATAPPSNVRPKEADLVGLLQAGEFDYIWSYESIAQATGLRYVRLPSRIDLSEPADSAFYAQASVVVAGRSPRDSITIPGEPIVYGFSVPVVAPDSALARRFAEFLLSGDGKRLLRAARLDALEQPIVVGDAPAWVTARASAP